MPNNRKISEQRALHLKRKLQTDSSLHADYTAFMNKLVAKGTSADQVPVDELECSDGKL